MNKIPSTKEAPGLAESSGPAGSVAGSPSMCPITTSLKFRPILDLGAHSKIYGSSCNDLNHPKVSHMRNDPPPNEEQVFACTLDEQGKAERELLDRPVARKLIGRERTGRRLVLRFRAEPGVEHDVRQLADREKQCCAFFDFEVTQDEHAVRLDVTAPEGAEEFLDAFFAEFAPDRG